MSQKTLTLLGVLEIILAIVFLIVVLTTPGSASKTKANGNAVQTAAPVVQTKAPAQEPVPAFDSNSVLNTSVQVVPKTK